MKRKVRLAYIRDCRNPERAGLALLFSTDINLDALEICPSINLAFRLNSSFVMLNGLRVYPIAKLAI
jgi:hypothetical protein